jgi:DNA repair protein RadC
VATQIIAQAGSVGALASCQAAAFGHIKGVGQARARQLAAVVELGRRVMKGPTGEAPQLNRAELVAAYLTPLARGLEVEKFWTLCLNRKNRLRKLVEITSGTANATLAHPREVSRAAIQHGATVIVIAHNHPSGDPAPSTADVQVTRQLRELRVEH